MADHDIPREHAQTLVDPAAYADGRIFETYAWLRANNPLGIARPQGFDPFWVVTRYDDIRAISLDNRRFPYGDRCSRLTDKASDDFTRAMTGGSPEIQRTLISMDPPQHAKFRRLTQGWFMPKNLKLLDERIGQLADKAVGRLATAGNACDFVTDVALHYPLEVILEILGIPQEDYPFMLRLTQEVFAPLDPDSMPEGVDPTDPAVFAQAQSAVQRMLADYFGRIMEEQRRHPKNDIGSLIANAAIDGEPMPPGDQIGYYAIVATAGHDTTSSSSAAAMWALATQPGLLDRLRRDPDLVPRFVEEAIRWATPVKVFMRSSAEPTEFAGRRFGRNDWLMLCYASGNRDESKISNGEAFDIDRPPFEHVAFGYGPHVCLGQHLARREMTALFAKLVPALRSVALAGEAELTRSWFVNGLKHLPIRYELA
jgi:cytochrome P450